MPRGRVPRTQRASGFLVPGTSSLEFQPNSLDGTHMTTLPTPQTTQQVLDERYGRVRRRGTRWAVVVASAIAVLAVGAFACITVANSLNTVEADATGFQVVDSRTVVVEFQLSAPPGSAVACALEAQDVQHGVVGWKVVEIAAGETHARAFRETIPTVAEATTGFVNSCWVT